MTKTLDVGGTEIAAALKLVGATDPNEDTETLRQLLEAVGTLPEETRAFVRAAPTLLHPDAEDHPEIPLPGGFESFALGLPDVDAFLKTLEAGYLGRYAATIHFLGLVPIGAQLQYGDFMYALACVHEYAPGVGGVMYYDEREVGTWGASVSAFLCEAAAGFWKQVEEQRDGLDEDELAEFEPDTEDVRDCFVLSVVPSEPPEPVLDDALKTAWDETWHRTMARASERWWMTRFLHKRFDAHTIDSLPTRTVWEAQKDGVATHYGDAMYWLFAHALLGNETELRDCIERTSAHPAGFVQAVAAAAPSLVGRFEGHRQALYKAARSR